MFKTNNKNTKATSLMSRDGMLYGPKDTEISLSWQS